MAIRLLDGGLGQELMARTGKVTGLWSVQALLDDPDVVRQVHLDYFRAGATLATTNTYSLLPDRLEAHGLQSRLEQLTQLACEQAIRARDEHGSGLIAGSLGPQGFSYQPDKCPPAEQAAEVYRRVCRAQLDFVDMFIAETMASVDQIRGALQGTSGFDKPVWIAMTVDDNDGTRLRSGEPVADAVALCAQSHAAAVLVNCSSPEAVSRAIPVLAQASSLPVGAYANGFTKISEDFNAIGATVDLLEKREDLGPDAYAGFVAQWIDAGATIIGGCCEVGPAHIRELARRFTSAD